MWIHSYAGPASSTLDLLVSRIRSCKADGGGLYHGSGSAQRTWYIIRDTHGAGEYVVSFEV